MSPVLYLEGAPVLGSIETLMQKVPDFELLVPAPQNSGFHTLVKAEAEPPDARLR